MPISTVKRKILVIAALFCLVCLTACGSTPVAQDLNQLQAGEIVAALSASGIHAQAYKETGAGGKYRVEVKREAYTEAMALIHEQGLPAEARPSFTDLIAQKGLIPSSRQVEALRMDRALAADIEESLKTDPSVLSAHVTVRLNILGSDQKNQTPPGAAAVITMVPGADLNEAEIKSLIAKSIPGVQKDQVLLITHQARKTGAGSNMEGVSNDGKRVVRLPLTNFLWIWRVPEDDYISLAITVFSSFVLTFCLGWMAGLAINRYSSAGRAALPSTRQAPQQQRILPAGDKQARKVKTNENLTEN